MKVFDTSILLLKKNIKSHLTYSLSLLFSIVVCFIFINFSDNPVLIQSDRARGILDPEGFNLPLSKGLPFVIIVFSWWMILYASQYYFNQRNNEYSLLMMSGMNLFSLMKYSLIQIEMILIIVIPLSFIIGSGALFIFNKMIYDYLHINHSIFDIPISTYITTIYALFMLVLVIIVVLIGSLHKSSILSLKHIMKNDYRIKKASKWSIIFVLIYLNCLINFFMIDGDWIYFEINSIVGMLGAFGILKKCIPSLLTYLKKTLIGINSYIILSHLSLSLTSTASLVFLMTIQVTGIIPILALQDPFSNEYVTGIISYIFIVILLLVSIIYKLNIELDNKDYEYAILEKIGYTKKQLKYLMYQENNIYYTMILLIPMPYLLSISYQYIKMYHISIMLLNLLLLFYIIIIFISLMITNQSYKKIFWRKPS